MLEILTKLRNKHPHLFDEHTFARVQRHLLSNKQASMKAADDGGVWEKIERELRTLRNGAKRWRPSHRRFGALAAGIRLAYRLGYQARARAQSGQNPTNFHDWRKRIKVLWYQLRLIEVGSPRLRTDVRLLHRAEAWLGDDHNVVVLCTELSKHAWQRGVRPPAVASRCGSLSGRPEKKSHHQYSPTLCSRIGQLHAPCQARMEGLAPTRHTAAHAKTTARSRMTASGRTVGNRGAGNERQGGR